MLRSASRTIFLPEPPAEAWERLVKYAGFCVDPHLQCSIPGLLGILFDDETGICSNAPIRCVTWPSEFTVPGRIDDWNPQKYNLAFSMRRDDGTTLRAYSFALTPHSGGTLIRAEIRQKVGLLSPLTLVFGPQRIASILCRDMPGSPFKNVS